MKNYKKFLAACCAGLWLISGSMTQVQADSGDVEGLPELQIGCEEYEPYNYMDENGKMAGIDADIAEEACKRMGYNPVYYLLDWSVEDYFLEEGIIDCIWSCFSINGREDDYLWSEPYMYSSEAVMVSEDSGIRKIEDLKGRIAAVQEGTRSEEILLRSDILPDVMPGNVYSFQTMEEGISALDQGYADVAAGDRLYMTRALERLDGSFQLLDENLEVAKIAVAFAKNGDKDLVEKLNDTLTEMKEDGTISFILKRYNADGIALTKEEPDE